MSEIVFYDRREIHRRGTEVLVPELPCPICGAVPLDLYEHLLRYHDHSECAAELFRLAPMRPRGPDIF